MRRPSSGTLSAAHVTVAHGTRPVLDDVSFVLGPRARVGIVGPNGVGKSTLMRVLAGLQTPDMGTVSRAPASLTVGYLPQEVVGESNEKLLAYLSRRTGVATAEVALAEAAAALEQDPTATDAYGDALELYLALGGDDLPARAAAIVHELGLGDERLDQALGTMSGGQRARAGLAAILLSRFDVLLLDEPTNDLDFAGLDLLEGFVTSTATTLAVVSHDRAFLEHTVDRVIELDERHHRAAEYRGGWQSYLEARETALAHGYEAYERYRGERDRLLARSRQQRQWAAKGAARATKRPSDPDKFVRRRGVETSEKLASKARATEQALARLEVAEKPWEGWDLRLRFPAAPPSAEVVARLDGAVVEQGAFRLGPVDVDVRHGDRVAVLGPNGSGKTTLLQALLGHLPLAAGRRQLGPRVVVGELDQARHLLDAAPTVLAAVESATGLMAEETRSLLAKLGVNAAEASRPAATLSPGERTRALLGVLVAKGVNCLVLDEPTNHLDLPAIEELEKALDGYDGTLLLVSHDRRLLEHVRLTRTIELG